MQEPFNEVIASKILNELSIRCVNYELKRTIKGIPYCECECASDNEMEYINARYIFNMEHINRKDQYQHYIDICESQGLFNIKKDVDDMLSIDLLIGNVDRHSGNFGILRNYETLEWVKTFPIFDNGNSLFHDMANSDIDSFGIVQQINPSDTATDLV